MTDQPPTPPAAEPSAVTIAALYHFAALADPTAMRGPMQDFCQQNGLRGTILLANEGINGTIAGSAEAVTALLAHLRAMPPLATLEAKFSHAPAMPFLRMKVRLKAEIVSMGVPDLDVAAMVGDYVRPEDWNALIACDDVILIDTRNDYEVGIGSFAGAINPGTDSFRDFPAWFDAFAERLTQAPSPAPPKIAMFCTGGIRCEKATAYVRSRGFDAVYHLQGGILKYLETVPDSESQWQGSCFVFDQRVAVDSGLAPADYVQCHACRRPLSPDQLADPAYEAGVSCPHCIAERGPEQRARYAERQRQMALAAQRGAVHLGRDTGKREAAGEEGAKP
jgi:UPF0176 protein